MSQTYEVLVNEPTSVGPASASSPTAVSGAAWPSRLLLVTDGSFDSDGAIAAAAAFAEPGGPSVELMMTYAPRIPLPMSADRCGLAKCEQCDRQEIARVLRGTRDRLRHVIPGRAGRASWRTRVEIGDPGAMLVRVADQLHPDLVLVGIGQREVYDERAGGRTAVCAARYLDASLLAAARDYAPPERCVVAFPRGRVHAPTVCAALACMQKGGTVYLAFPKAIPTVKGRGVDDDDPRHAVLEACGPEIAANLDGVELVRVDVADDMLTGILELAEHVSATLIAVPNFGRAGPVRAFLPNLAEPLLFAAQCSVLVVPS